MNDRISGWKWIAVAALVLGIILRWIHIDPQGILMSLGFLLFGVFALVEGIKSKYYQRLTVDTLLVILPLIIITAAIGNIVSGNTYYVPTLVSILALSVISRRNQFTTASLKKSTDDKQETIEG